ncbi:MAG: nucleotidyltransferase [Saprospiraceae bacterium]|jgi:hypothetical protein|uniref:DUF6036 family nucleotidyltransferase n=1 Tax=Candidatus Brachybacter algidus TaxID=2982024 RepID=UPI001B72AA56|nr:nucleotidyltransferase [Candidatus Brachybacter algidus]MBP7541711.1 nucleotidyltransferase [Saprospiraceae bacterium]MBK6450611.1 nucleotidyltransferase [Candidatus Brachybacter algidus]MBK7605411.1 nucleotidyltransferase [Candidatus Brachybacter algidus]MBK8356399.1 nucleotidyltransferase [Candidatus Brachybacter algidus]MBK8842619.1 nucleotidyltransferase [Candidatus Brachybacter algidus]
MTNNIFNSDFNDFLSSFERAGVEYVLVGGYSVIIHGYQRTTGDMDLFVNPTSENYSKIIHAFDEFGMSLFSMTLERFLNIKEFDVFEFGRPPVSIDIMTKMKGVEFEEVFNNKVRYQVEEDLIINVIHLNQLITAKKSSARHKDLNDIEQLTKKN